MLHTWYIEHVPQFFTSAKPTEKYGEKYAYGENFASLIATLEESKFLKRRDVLHN